MLIQDETEGWMHGRLCALIQLIGSSKKIVFHMIIENALVFGKIFSVEKKRHSGYTGKRFKAGLKFLAICIAVMLTTHANAQTSSGNGWYTQGNFVPTNRISVTVTNSLSVPLKYQPVSIKRSELPMGDIPERWVDIVDPDLPGNKEPTAAELKDLGGYVIGKETNGHSIHFQLDDLDKDGVWDEIFFLSDFAPGETRRFYIYFDFHERGLYPHEVHANIANYGHHTVPLLESEIMGWKLWYPHDLDLHGKRKPMLTAYYEYSTNRSGYYMPFEMGTDIMTVQNTFGAGGMCLFENPDDPEHPARAYYSPNKDKGPIKDTRFAFDVVCNGPLRSIIKVKTTNWNSVGGFYELEQNYTVVAHKAWCIVDVHFNKFLPPQKTVMFGAGIRRIMDEYKSVNKGGMVISMGKNIPARIPDEDIGDSVLVVPWEGIALVVKDEFKPHYVAIKNYGGNHLFQIPETKDLSYQYMAVDGWSFGEVNNNEKDFTKYVEMEGLKYNNPPVVKVFQYEKKGK